MIFTELSYTLNFASERFARWLKFDNEKNLFLFLLLIHMIDEARIL